MGMHWLNLLSLILPSYHGVNLSVKVTDKLYHKLVSSTPAIVENQIGKTSHMNHMIYLLMTFLKQ